MIKIGLKARLLGVSPELCFANIVLLGILLKYNAAMVITHVVDGTHTRASIHYAGGAEDLTFLGTLEANVKQQIYDEWKGSVGQDFDILFEDVGTPNEHIHCEFQPKEPYK